MKPQPEQPRAPRPIPPIHPDTIAFERHLRSFAVGQRVSYADLAALVRKDLRTQESAVKSHIRSAERRLQNLEGMVFGPFHDEKEGIRGRVRLDDAGIVDLATHRTGQLGRSAKRIVRLAGCANPDVLSDDKKNQQATAMLAARGAQKFSEAKGRAVISRLLTNSKERIADLDTTWRALQNA